MTHDLPVTRRAALAAGTAALGAAMTRTAPAADENLPWIDAHSHIWPPEVDKYPLAPGQTKKDLDPPSFTDDELMKLARPEGVGRVVLIQHSVYHLWDNSYLLDAVKRHPKPFRVQGMVDDHKPDPGAAMKKLLPLGVTGFRITPFVRKKDEQPKWLDTPGDGRDVEDRGRDPAGDVPADQPVRPAGDRRDVREAPGHPGGDRPLRPDRGGRGDPGRGREGAVQAGPAQAHARQGLGLLRAGQEEAAARRAGADDPPAAGRFGPKRLMWASDAPYQMQGVNTYKASIALVRDRLDFLPKQDREWLLAKTAEAVFFHA